jgi:hypothetical protein
VPIPITSNPESAARTYVTHWFELLAEQRWREALAMLDVPNSYGVTWSEVNLQEALAEYSNGKAISVTSPKALSSEPHVSSGEFSDGSGFWFDCDVPMNDAWSDLTAQFEFKSSGGQYLVALEDIHVL